MRCRAKGTKFFAMFMTLVLAVGCVGEVSYAAEPASKQETALETVSGGDLVAVDISDNLLHKGGLLKEYEAEEQEGYGEETLPQYLAVDRDTYIGVEELLKAAYDSFATECSLSQYQLTPAELKEIVAEVLNTNPRYFYVYGGYSYSASGGYVTRILLQYDYEKEQAESMLQAYDAAVRQAVNGASSDWSDLEKALYINDYLTRNCEYDTTYSNYDAYDVLVTKMAVCQGYALAYLELANQLGLSAEVVTSTSLNHAWNMIEINGKYYQEDATWNDPVSDRLGRARHLYFMKSTEYYQTEVDHYEEDDWVVSGGLTWTDASATDYDGYFWNAVDVGFEYVDGYWYGFDGVDRIVKYDCDGSALQEVEELLQIDDVWRVTGSNSYYSSKYLGLGQFDGKLYYSNTDTIYCYDPDTEITEEVYGLTEEEKELGSIYAMHITPAGEVYYYLSSALSTTGTIYLATVLTKDDSDIGDDSGEGDNPEPEIYTITYELDGGENHGDNPTSYTENDYILFEIPTRANYVFDGWYTDAEYTNPIVGISVGTTGNLVLYAKWVERVYDISFDGNGSTDGQMLDMMGCLFDQNYVLAANSYERTGYIFKGWNTNADGTGKSYKNQASVTSLSDVNGATIILYAQWTPIKYTIKFNGNGATGGKMSNLTNRKYGTSYKLTVNAYKRTGYTFTGWNTKANGKGKSYKNKASVKNLTPSNGGTVTLYAQWTPIKYTIKFNGNGATSGKMSSLTNRKYGTTYKLTANAYKKKGYTFVGWNTKKNGKGKNYKNKASVKNLISSNGKTITLYAQWKKK